MLHKQGQKNSREVHKSGKKVYTNTIRLLFQHTISLFLGQGILIGISILILMPFLSFIFRSTLSLAGYSYLTINNIGLFLLNPLVIILLTFLFVVIGIFLLLEACYLITFYTFIENGEKPYQLKIIRITLKKLLLIILRRNFTLIPMVWLIIGLSNIPLIIFIMKRVRLISFISKSLYDKTFTIPVTVIITVLLLWIMVRKLFIFLYSLIEGKTYVKTPKSGNKKNNDENKKNSDENKKNNDENKTNNDENKTNNDRNKKNSDANKTSKTVSIDKKAVKNNSLKASLRSMAVIDDSYIKRINTFRTLLYFLFWNIGIGLTVLALYILTMAITTLFIAGIPDKSLAIATFLTINDKMNGYLFIGIFAICTIANFALYTHLFFQYKLELNEKIDIDHTVDNIVINVGAYKTVIKVSIILLALANFYSFYQIIRNGSPLNYMNLKMTQVTSHRGFSNAVPENTLPAIEKAMEEQADYVEVDVRMTKDGELVLLHDDNLNRTTGVNKKIWEVTYAEASHLDAGSWKNKVYAGTKIPTLQEVFELCKGKVNLNLDLKYRNNNEGLEEKVVALIEEYDMKWQCVISSTSLNALSNVKLLDPDIRTGYITYQIYRGYFKNDNIDFFSMKSNLVTKTVSSEVHKAGKEIHVWTVNSKDELQRMKRLGVDNIITDDPSYAKEVLYQEESNQFLLTLLKIMME
jgi:glycerophosphoryl diester phosphodiesterase